MFVYRCSARTVGIVATVSGVCLIDSLEEGTRGYGGRRDGIDVSAILVDCEVAVGKAPANDTSLAIFLEPLVGLCSKSRCLRCQKNGIAKHLSLGIEANKHLQVAAKAKRCALYGSTEISAGR